MSNGIRISIAAACLALPLSAGCVSLDEFNQLMISLRFCKIDLSDSLAQARELQGQVDELNRTTRQMQSEYDVIFAAYQEMQTDLNDQKDQNAALTLQLADSRSRADKLAEDLKGTQTKLASAQKDLETLKDKLQAQEKQMQAQEKESQAKIAGLQSDLAGLSDRNKKLAAELETLTKKTAELDQQLAAKEKQNRALIDKLDVETATRKEVEGRLALTTDLAGRYETLNKALMVRVTELEQQVRDLKAKTAGASADAGQKEKPRDINGLITTVKDNLAAVNVGKRHGLAAGQRLTIYRADKFLGYLKIDQLTDDLASGIISDSQGEIVAGDKITSDLAEKVKTALAEPAAK
ncbi:MAG: hypothetical protein HZA50_00060 [Planctomycetes bacterium]|nr:hypothetical protein [Planctomycetota bacterium]